MGFLAEKLMKSYDVYIGIDPGTNTGVAAWNPFFDDLTLQTMKVHKAMEYVSEIAKEIPNRKCLVRFEDARQRKWFGEAGREQLQGAGSIKRDCAIWEDFLRDSGIDFEMVPPKNIHTKISADYFKKLTGYEGRTSKHSRDAAMLVWGM